ncbi:MAG: alpha/beta hydrolase [Deltaproteobacteria bacterium]|nr:alpha/beta hydrolase [Deltaproteobacteria bacterium]
MILNSTPVEQTIDGERRGRFIKEIVLARPDGSPLGFDDEAGSDLDDATDEVEAAPLSHDHDEMPPVGGLEAERAAVPLAMVRKRRAPAEPSAGGTAPTRGAVLLIHGYGQNRYVWHLPARSFSNHLAAEGFDVFNLDLRGHGRSRHLGARPPRELSDYVRDDVPAALAEVRRTSGHDKVFLVGHSLGGLISYAAAPTLAAHVAGIVTLGSPYHFTRGSRFLSTFGSFMLAVDRRLPLGDALPFKDAGELMRLARVFIESPLFPLPIRGHAPGAIEPRVLGQHMSLAMDRGSVAVMRNLFLRAAQARASGHRLGVLYGFAAAFEALELPLLVIAGSEDGLAPPEAVRPAYERSNSPDKSYQVFPNGHIDIVVGREAPRTIWPLISDWMKARVAHRAGRAAVNA